MPQERPKEMAKKNTKKQKNKTALLWLWRRPAATAPIRPIAWEPPYAAKADKRKSKKTKKKKRYKKKGTSSRYAMYLVFQKCSMNVAS